LNLAEGTSILWRMPDEPITAEKFRRLPYIMAFDAFNSVFCQLTVFGSVFVLFLSGLGMDKARIGFLLSLISFASMGAIFLAPLSARIGVKPTFLGFWTARNLFVAGMLATPWALARWGPQGAFAFMTCLMIGFAVCRAFGEAANSQWRLEIIPHHFRGRFGAIDNITMTAVTVTAVFLAGVALSRSGSTSGYLWVMGVGTVVGLASVLWASRLPAGARMVEAKPIRWHARRVAQVVRDRNFLLYMAGLSVVGFGTAPLSVFVPLYFKEELGIDPATVVLLQNGPMIGALLSSYLWGWAADKFGSKPVLLLGLGMLLVPPVGWLVMPASTAYTIPATLAVMFVGGVASIGYGLGVGRQLYVTIVPYRRRTHYMSVFVAWSGAASGLAQLLAGQAMGLAHGVAGSFIGIAVSPYTFLFLFSIAMLVVGLVLQRWVEVQGAMPVASFLGLFLRGNPMMAVDSLLRYNLASRESDRALMIRRLGRTGSPLSHDALADALDDPSFNVRYEAILAISRTRPDRKLTGDLMEMLISGQGDLSAEAALALARVGDPSAIPALRWTLASPFPLLRLRSARALAAFADADVLTDVERAARRETDPAMVEGFAQAAAMLRDSSDRPALAQRLRKLRRTRKASKLLAALNDDDFRVRYEAVELISQRRPRQQYIEALEHVVLHGEPDLGIEAAWAMARMGGPAAIGPLRKAMDSGYLLLRVRAARGLARLQDRGIVPEVRRRLAEETDASIAAAYAAVLGELRIRHAARDIAGLGARLKSLADMSEVNLALARLIGFERDFIRLWRKMRSEPGTTAARELLRLTGRAAKLDRRAGGNRNLSALLRETVQAIGTEQLERGAVLLGDLLAAAGTPANSCLAAVADCCRQHLAEPGLARTEAVPLAICALKAVIGERLLRDGGKAARR
jgi:HEAT repeat protein/MFS-type transporter involved in bile tolerance (Atg22 family)